MTLKDALLILVSGGGGAIVYWLMENVKFLKNLAPDYKRYASIGLSMLLPVLAWLVMIAMSYEQAPSTWQGWIESIFALAAGAIIISQGLHGALQLKPKRTG